MNKTYLGYKNKASMKLFLSCWVAYFSTYICRLNFSVVMPELAKGNRFTEAQLASVSSAFFICYGIGQLFSGRLGDKCSPRILIFLGTFISALSNIFIFAFHGSHTVFMLLWGLNGAVQSLVWSPILRIAGDYYDKPDREKFGTDISTTVTLGTLASYGLGLVTLLFLPWNYVFLICGACTLTASVFWIVSTNKLDLCKISKSDSSINTITLKQFFRLFLISGCLILSIPIAIHGTLKDSVTQWMPTFLDNCFHLGTDISVVLTMVLPVVNVLGAYIARAINKKIQNELKTAVVFFIAAMVFLILLTFAGTKSPFLALLCLAVITTCMHAVNVMFITMVPLRFSKYNCTSTIGGLLNAVAYIGCGALNLVSGKLLTNTASWSGLFIFWMLLCTIGILLTSLSSILWKKFTST